LISGPIGKIYAAELKDSP